MPSASNTSNSSNITSTIINTTLTQSVGSRLVVVLENEPEGLLAPGLVGGDVIRYDVTLNGYTRASADAIANSEVFGVVEKVNSDNSIVVVTYGTINLPSNRIININGFNYGGNDIYFLSADNPGYLQNLPPSSIGQVIKPVYQVAPTTSGTGSVVNYVGYVIQE
jgi:hypothetical protein